ncbi:MAG: hypothetical protein OXE42_13705 [Gammaproteobacteria bacterium]|nr:hypothetical protein [Gammaproteobacteria bacterium]
MSPEKIIQSLLEEFKKLEQTEIKQTQWSRAVLTALCRVGRQLGCSVWASSQFVNREDKDGGEWLYDVTWLKYKGDFLKLSPMVAECEWGNIGAIKDDFEKLILARAAVRVMVFDGMYCKNGAEGIVNKFCDWVGAYESSQKRDTYLLIGYERDEKYNWWFRYFNILVDDPSQQPILTRL